MKYLISDSRIENLIKNFILDNYDVVNVDFTTKSVRLGSGPNKEGHTVIARKIINIDVNNYDGRYNNYKVAQIGVKIGEDLNSFFGISFGEYGSEWGLKIYSLVRKELYNIN